MSDINYRRNAKKYNKRTGHGWTKRSRKASAFWKRYYGDAKTLRRIVIELEYE